MKTFLMSFLALVVCPMAWSLEDEPDELNWDTLGGTLTGFSHFRTFCETNETFRGELLREKKVDSLDRRLHTVWVTPEAFAAAKIRQWDVQDVHGEPCIVTAGAHNGNMVRIAVDIPRSGYYRVWTKYWHEQGQVASFNLALGDRRLADLADPSLTVVQDEWSWRYDWAEWARRGEPLPNRKGEPTGWLWEASPLTWIEKGVHSLTLHGLTCDDEEHNYMGDQSVSIYRGAALRTISTRNAEAIREAVQRFRQAKCDQLHPKEPAPEPAP